MPEERIWVEGGHRLEGRVRVSGGKNSSVAIIAGMLLSHTPCTVENVPDIEDVRVSIEILCALGAAVKWDKDEGRLTVDASGVTRTEVPRELCHKMRASYYYIGALLGRFGSAHVFLPGGCVIGKRPIDQHIKGMEKLGAVVTQTDEEVICEAPDGLVGSDVYMDVATVGGTVNVMLAACCAKGRTTIHNAAKEPHVVDLANFLNRMGCKIKGAGTDMIRIDGVESPKAKCPYAVIPDQNETGTLMIAAAATHGDVLIEGCIPTHMEALTAKLLEMGVFVEAEDETIHVKSDGNHRSIGVKTQVYPGFPTDLQQPMSVLMCTARGRSTIKENIFDNRFLHLNELKRMGARVEVKDGDLATIEGITELYGQDVEASDLRAGAALVIAGLIAKGETRIGHTCYIDRGYANLEEKLTRLGANIKRICI